MCVSISNCIIDLQVKFAYSMYVVCVETVFI